MRSYVTVNGSKCKAATRTKHKIIRRTHVLNKIYINSVENSREKERMKNFPQFQ